MSTNSESISYLQIFMSKPFDEPPPLKGHLVDGHPTPTYDLAWVCPNRKFYENLGGGRLDVVSRNWCARPELGALASAPLPYPGADGNFYLIAIVDNHVIESARVAMGVNLDPSLENTLMWYRRPLHWLHAERIRRRCTDFATAVH
ncbi:hypothetical protein B0H14DRAFT_2727604 [Mycena olivaceomarginata]|nr:hypothetical protein B0H14DRAFT_2727604 [Mycena olivaceomarginata]